MEKPKLKILGEDGNAFMIIGKALKALRLSGHDKTEIAQFTKEATSGDYENLLKVCSKYFDCE
jgi:hypothetical protein